MTLDEAIKHAVDVTEINLNKEVQFEDVACGECAMEHQQLVEWLEELKAYKNGQDGWIRVEDHLPKKDGHYLVSIKNLCLDYKWRRYVKIDLFRDGIWSDDAVDHFIIAWKPIPGPYMGETTRK